MDRWAVVEEGAAALFSEDTDPRRAWLWVGAGVVAAEVGLVL